MLIGIAREKGVSAYIGDGGNHWPAVHRLDAAHLYRLVLERGVLGNGLLARGEGLAGARYHGVAEEGVLSRDIADLDGTRYF